MMKMWTWNFLSVECHAPWYASFYHSMFFLFSIKMIAQLYRLQDACLLGALEDGLNALLNIEVCAHFLVIKIRWLMALYLSFSIFARTWSMAELFYLSQIRGSKLQNRVRYLEPPSATSQTFYNFGTVHVYNVCLPFCSCNML